MANETLRKSPWNELDYYKEGQPIYGRDEEIWRVSNGICQNLQTIIYGQSGIGKSSLLFAGVFPQLRKDNFFPVFIRLGIPSNKSYDDRVVDEVLEEASRIDHSIGKVSITHKTTIRLEQSDQEDRAWKLWNFFSTTRFSDSEDHPFIPVLVFDQFEEVLNNAETHNQAEQFLLDIYSLIDDTRITPDGCIPYSNFRVVFSLREDYLYCFEDIIDKYNLNELRYNRYRITAMGDKNARDVILRTSNDVGGCLEKGKESLICDKIIEESKSNNYLGEISTLMLSLICSVQYENAKDGIVKYDSLANNADYLYNYYSSKMSVVEYKTQEYLEDKLITSDGRRNSIDLKDAKDSGKVSDSAIESLVNTRIIRLVSSGGSSQRIEFIHDTLTKVVNNKKKTLWQCFVHACRNINNFSGHADRKEWIASFLPVLFSLVGLILCAYFNPPPQIVLNSTHDALGLFFKALGPFYYVFLFGMAVCFPTSVRRCHDFGQSGWKVFLYLFALPFKPSSSVIYKSTSSGITWRRIFIQKSLTHIEYRILSARLLAFVVFSTLFVLPLFFYGNELVEKIGWLLLFVVLVPMINGHSMLFLMRFSSTNLPLFSTLIPGFNIFQMIRLYFPAKNDNVKKINNIKILVLSIVFIPSWLAAAILLYYINQGLL